MPRNVIKPRPTFVVERTLIASGRRRIAGADEVGVGAVAGPLVAAAVVLPLPIVGLRFDQELDDLARLLEEVRDSKQLKTAQRERLATLIQAVAALDVGIGMVEVAELARIGNQSRAATLATIRALEALPTPPEVVLLDGALNAGNMTTPSIAVRKVYNGTASLSIAAASIIASVAHHRIMAEYGELYPAYGFHRHNGHISPAHLDALTRHGPSPVHHSHHRLVRAALRGVSEYNLPGAAAVDAAIPSSLCSYRQRRHLMSDASISSITFDCAEPKRLAAFWAAVLGYQIGEDDPDFIQTMRDYGHDPDDEASVEPSDPARPRLYFNRVSEPKVGKNRVHIDLGVADIAVEVARLEALGARVVRRVTNTVGPYSETWTTMADPEGNEFCVQQRSS